MSSPMGKAQRRYKREWSRRNAEKMRSYRRRWRERNPGYEREWKRKNAEKVREYKRRYRERAQADPVLRGREVERCRRWRTVNRERENRKALERARAILNEPGRREVLNAKRRAWARVKYHADPEYRKRVRGAKARYNMRTSMDKLVRAIRRAGYGHVCDGQRGSVAAVR